MMAGYDAHLSKPVNLHELIATVTGCARIAASSTAATAATAISQLVLPRFGSRLAPVSPEPLGSDMRCTMAERYDERCTATAGQRNDRGFIERAGDEVR